MNRREFFKFLGFGAAGAACAAVAAAKPTVPATSKVDGRMLRNLQAEHYGRALSAYDRLMIAIGPPLFMPRHELKQHEEEMARQDTCSARRRLMVQTPWMPESEAIALRKEVEAARAEKKRRARLDDNLLDWYTP